MKTEAKSALKTAAYLLVTLTLASASFAQTGPAFRDKTNEILEVRRVLRQASQIADSFTEQWKAEVLSEIAILQGKSGNLQDALRTIDSIKGSLGSLKKVQALLGIAEAQAKAGNRPAAAMTLRQAREMTDKLEPGIQREFWLGKMAEVQAKIDGTRIEGAQDHLPAQATAPSPDADVKERALTQAKVGDMRAAIQTLAAIQDDRSRRLALEKLALSRAKAGDAQGALQLAQSIPSKALYFMKARALAQIATVQAKAGDVKAALQTTKSITEDSTDASLSKAEAVMEIATVQAKAGDRVAASANFQDAIRIVEATRPELGHFKAIGLSEIAIAQAKAGDPTAAAMTLQNSLEVANATSTNYGPFSKAGGGQNWGQISSFII